MHFDYTHPSWHSVIQAGISAMSTQYLDNLLHDNQLIPKKNEIFNAFCTKKQHIKYLLMGESPYPRAHSANGFAFWDSNVNELWSNTGLNKQVNKATSLRNIIKMLLVANNYLVASNVTQKAIVNLNKSLFINNLSDLFNKMIDHGFLLLNASLVLSSNPVNYNSKQWLPFIKAIIDSLLLDNPSITILLFGKIAHKLKSIIPDDANTLIAQHPYNNSFITNTKVLDFFQQFDLLRK